MSDIYAENHQKDSVSSDSYDAQRRGRPMSADRTERKPTAYERVCADACPDGCGKGYSRKERGTLFPFDTRTFTHFHWENRQPCTAPSRDAVIESQATELARVTKERDEAQRNAAMLMGDEKQVHLGALAAISAIKQIAALKQERDELRDALTTIQRTPTMPFPDHGSHSERAFSEAVWRAWMDIQRIAYDALDACTAQQEGK